MASPRVSKSLELMRKRGYLSQVVQQWVPHFNGRVEQSQGSAGFRYGSKRDLFNIIDVLCIRQWTLVSCHTTETVGVQVLGDDVLSHLLKIWESKNTGVWLYSESRSLLLHSWVKRSTNGVMRWVLREKEICLGDLDADPKEFWEQWKAEIKAEESLRKAKSKSGKPSSSQAKKANAKRSSKKEGSSSSRSTAKTGRRSSKASQEVLETKATNVPKPCQGRTNSREKDGRLQRVPKKPRLAKKA